MANIDKGAQKMTSLEEKKGTMNSEYFGFMSRDEIQLDVGFKVIWTL